MVDPADLAMSLALELSRRSGRPGLEVRELKPLSGGASRDTFSFDLHDPAAGSTEPLILQRVRPGAVSASFSMEGEGALLRAASAAGVPVAPVVAVSDDASVIGAPFLVMGRVEGETIGRRILRDEAFAAARPVLTGQCAAALAGIHALGPADAPSLREQEPLDQLRGLLDHLGQPHPAFELGLRWLAAHRPPPTEPRVVHGDFRLGNLMIDESGLVAVLDWELAHLGDPMEDLGWLCVRAWRFGSDRPVGGVGERDDLYAAYAEATGSAVDPAVVRWWEVAGTLRWGVICILQASAHLSGASRSVELAAIGRRVCETEYDLLCLIGARAADGRSPAGSPTGDTTSGADLHGAPTAAQLVEAVREFLEGDVMAATQGRVQFHARVAAKVLAMVERELGDGDTQVGAHRRRLDALGVPDDAALAAAIRSGVLDDRSVDVRSAIWLDVLAKVRVANPGYLLSEDAS